MVECPACAKDYDNKEELDNHMSQDHGELKEIYLAREFLLDVPHQCAMCDEELDPNEPMTDHMRVAHGINTFSAPVEELPQDLSQPDQVYDETTPEDADMIDDSFSTEEEDSNLENDIVPDLGEPEESDPEDEAFLADETEPEDENEEYKVYDEYDVNKSDEGENDEEYKDSYDLENNYKSDDIESNECDQCNSGFDSKNELNTHKNDVHVEALEFHLDNKNFFFEGLVKTQENDIEPEEVIDAEHNMLDAGIDEEKAHDILKDLGDDKEEGEEQDHTGKHTDIYQSVKDDPDVDEPWALANWAVKKHGLETNIYSSVYDTLMQANEDFKEEEHPREASGMFTSGGDSGKSDSDIYGEKPKKTPNKMQGDIIRDGKSITSKGSGYDKWKAEQDAKKAGTIAEPKVPKQQEAPKPKKSSGGGFDKAKKQSLDYLKKQSMKYKERSGDAGGSLYYSDDIEKLENMKGFPTDSKSIRGMSTVVKAKLAKSHVQSEYPDSQFSVKSESYSGGSSFTVNYKGGKYPYGANKLIDGVYEDRGGTDIQSDYFDYDNYASMHDDRGYDSARAGDPQTIADSREERLKWWVQADLGNVDYNDLHNWSQSVSKDLVETGKFVSFTGMTEEHETKINNAWKRFREQEKKEGVGESYAVEEFDEKGTFWFTTNVEKDVGIKQGQNLEDALKEAGVPLDDEYDDSQITGDDMSDAEKGYPEEETYEDDSYDKEMNYEKEEEYGGDLIEEPVVEEDHLESEPRVRIVDSEE